MEGFGRQQCGIRETRRAELRTVKLTKSYRENCVILYLNVVQVDLKNVNKANRLLINLMQMQIELQFILCVFSVNEVCTQAAYQCFRTLVHFNEMGLTFCD